jgi:glucose-6-phosphate 1-dehydrogenase
VFRDVPHRLFEEAGVTQAVEPNRLALRIQPDEGVSLSFAVQRPGLGIALDEASLRFDYGATFADTPLVEAYEMLLLEAMHGDQTLFIRQESLERAWEVLAPVIEDAPPLHEYEPGSWGPEEADALISPRRWHLL